MQKENNKHKQKVGIVFEQITEDLIMLEPRKRTALDGKTYWCVFNTDTMKWSTLTCFGKYTRKKDCQFAIDLCTKGEFKASLEDELEEILDDIGVVYNKYGYEIVDTEEE